MNETLMDSIVKHCIEKLGLNKNETLQIPVYFTVYNTFKDNTIVRFKEGNNFNGLCSFIIHEYTKVLIQDTLGNINYSPTAQSKVIIDTAEILFKSSNILEINNKVNTL